MKWVKRILGSIVGVLALAVIVLLILGRRESANRLQGSVEIGRPPAEVYAWITDKEKLPRWVGWLVEVRESGPAGVGARQVWVMDDPNMNERIEMTTEVTALEPPHRLSVRSVMEGGFDGTVTYTLTDLGQGRTRIETTSQWTFHHWLARLLEPVITRSAQKKLVDDFARLKSLAEAEPELANVSEPAK